MRVRAPWLVLSAVLACGPVDARPEIPPIVWVGEHLEYAPQDGAPEPCVGTLPYMDRFVALAAEAMGVELRGPVVFVHGDDADVLCGSERPYGCAVDEAVYAQGVPQEHELVHGVRSQFGFSSGFFEEGAAEAFGDDAYLSNRGLPRGDPVEGMIAGVDGELPDEWYPRAGHFVAWLHEHYGIEVTKALLLETEPGSSVGSDIAVLERATGVSIDEILGDYSSEPTCRQRQYRFPLHPCAQVVDLWARCEGTVELGRVRLACDDESTLGPREHDGMFRYLTVEVAQDGYYVITAFDQNQVFMPFALKECALGCDSILAGRVDEDDVSPVFLRAGRYALKLSRYPEYPTDVRVMVEGVGCG